MEKSDIRIAGLKKTGPLGLLLKIIGPFCDVLLGINGIRKAYERCNFQGDDKYDFIKRFIEVHNIQYSIEEKDLRHIPSTGPVLLVANHPLGGLEGIILSYVLKTVRKDYKFLVNLMLMVIRELKDFYFFTNPMIKNTLMNFKAVKDCRKWLGDEHCLLIFPAGRVGLFDFKKGYVTDEKWNRVAIALAHMTKAPVVPIYVGGQSSFWFNFFCHLFYPNRLLLLANEFLKSMKHKITFKVGRPIPERVFTPMSQAQGTAYLRMRTYLLYGIEHKAIPVDRVIVLEDKILSLLKATKPYLENEDYLLFCFYKPGQIHRLIPIVEKATGIVLSREVETDIFLLWDAHKKSLVGGALFRKIGKAGRTAITGRENFISTVFPKKRNELNRIKSGGEIIFFPLIEAYEYDAVAADILWKGLDMLLEEKNVTRVVGALTLPGTFSPLSNSLIEYSLIKNNRGSWKKYAPFLHREVIAYIHKYGLTVEELEDILPSLESGEPEVPSLLKIILNRQGVIHFSSRTEGDFSPPALFFKLPVNR